MSTFEQAVREMAANGMTSHEIKAEVDTVIAKMTDETAARVYGQANPS